MTITLKDTGRRYDQEWIFRHLDYTFVSGTAYAILGPNGSGKSTLIKTLTGSLSPSEGKVDYALGDEKIDKDQIYRYMTIAAPYVELIEEFSLGEMIDFHFKFKAYKSGFDKERILQLLALNAAGAKDIKHFSSGMKQRLRLALACCSQGEVVFLDEPTSNLDQQGEKWYLSLLEETKVTNSLLIIGSNQEKEYSFCQERLHILSFK